jgi:hypothetical protein
MGEGMTDDFTGGNGGRLEIPKAKTPNAKETSNSIFQSIGIWTEPDFNRLYRYLCFCGVWTFGVWDFL